MRAVQSTTVSIAYPLMLNVTNRLTVIIGGGAVALRKAQGLIEAGATRIRMVSPAFHNEIPTVVEKITSVFNPKFLADASLVFAATNSLEINDQVVREARQRGILVNRADSDSEEPGDFTTPAISRQGSIAITVSASGAPALAVMIRDEIALHSNPVWTMMAEAMHVIRPLILASPSLGTAERRDAFRSLATPQALDAVAHGGVDLLWERLVLQFPQLAAVEFPVHGAPK